MKILLRTLIILITATSITNFSGLINSNVSDLNLLNCNKDEKNYLDLGVYNLGFDLWISKNQMEILKNIRMNNIKTPLLGVQQFSNIIINFDYNKTDSDFVAEHKQIVENISMALFTQFEKAYKVIVKNNKGIIIHFATNEGDIFLSFIKIQ